MSNRNLNTRDRTESTERKGIYEMVAFGVGWQPHC